MTLALQDLPKQITATCMFVVFGCAGRVVAASNYVLNVASLPEPIWIAICNAPFGFGSLQSQSGLLFTMFEVAIGSASVPPELQRAIPKSGF